MAYINNVIGGDYLRLLQLKYFVEVASTENITRAARKLMVSQPSLSRTLKELEQELSVTLFIRNGHSLKLNQQGKEFAQKVNNALSQLDSAVETLKSFSSEQNQTITLRFETSSPMIPALVRIIKKQGDDVAVKLVQHGLENSRLENYDFEFSTHPISNNVNLLLIDEEIKVAVGKESKLSNLSRLTPLDLKNQKFIMTGITPLRTSIEEYLHNHGYKNVTPKFITSDRDTLRGLIAENMGISFVPEKSWLKVNTSDITLHSLYPDPPHRKIYLSYQPSMALNPFHEKVKKAIQDYFESLKL